MIQLDLESLLVPNPDRLGMGAYGGVWRDCAALRLEENGHAPGSLAEVNGSSSETAMLSWELNSPDLQLGYRNSNKVTEMAASGIAILLLETSEGQTFLEESRVDGRGVDYSMWPVGSYDKIMDLPPKQRLSAMYRLVSGDIEISGIGAEGDIDDRISAKRNRLIPGASAAICVVKFGTPEVRVAKI